MDRPERGVDLASPVHLHDHVGCERRQERLQVAAHTRLDEGLGDLLLLPSRRVESRTFELRDDLTLLSTSIHPLTDQEFGAISRARLGGAATTACQ